MSAVWWNDPPFSISEAEQRGVDVYEVILGLWGSDPNGDQWPPFGQVSIPVSLAAMAIGPKSLVDRAWVTWNMMKTAPTVPANSSEVPPTPGSTTGRIRQLSLNSPLLFSQAANSTGVANTGYTDPTTRQEYTMALLNALYVWDTEFNQAEPRSIIQSTNYGRIPNDTGIAATYIDLNGVIRAFGAQNDGVTGGVVSTNFVPGFGWVPPLLHLYLYLKAPLIAPSTTRPPQKVAYQCASTGQQFDASGNPINEMLIGLICVAGRSHVSVAVKSTAAGTYRIAAIKAMTSINAGVGSALGGIAPQELPVDLTSGEITANTWALMSSCAGEHLGADWLAIYATPTNPAAFPGFQVQVVATD